MLNVSYEISFVLTNNSLQLWACQINVNTSGKCLRRLFMAPVKEIVLLCCTIPSQRRRQLQTLCPKVLALPIRGRLHDDACRFHVHPTIWGMLLIMYQTVQTSQDRSITNTLITLTAWTLMIFLGEIWHLGNEKKVGVANGVRVISLGKGWVHVTIFRQIVSSISCQSVAGFLNFSICGSPSQVVLLSSWTWVLPFFVLCIPTLFGCFDLFMIGRVHHLRI